MSRCGDKVAYLSEHLANNAVTLHGFVNPSCTDIHAYPCRDHWHIGHQHPAAGERCKAEPQSRPAYPRRPKSSSTNRSKRGAA